MHRKSVILLSSDRVTADRYVRLLDSLDIDVSRLPITYLDNVESLPACDLVAVDANSITLSRIDDLERRLAEEGSTALMLIIPPELTAQMRFDARIASDFILNSGSADEFLVRVHNLLWPGEESSSADFVRIDDMTINFATYQVEVGGEPVDFTYLEYALLAFLVSHPGKTYSRDALLRRVWGFEYYGGSRTVDVHVRRVRSKLGPDLAARLKTVRGVGYLWSM